MEGNDKLSLRRRRCFISASFLVTSLILCAGVSIFAIGELEQFFATNTDFHSKICTSNACSDKRIMVCIKDEILGQQDNNRIVQIANTIQYAQDKYGNNTWKVGIPSSWSEFFFRWFDLTPAMTEFLQFGIGDTEGLCDEILDYNKGYFYVTLWDPIPALCQLQLRGDLRREAEKEIAMKRTELAEEGGNVSEAITSNKTRIISVHRRFLDGECDARYESPTAHFCTFPDQPSPLLRSICSWNSSIFDERHGRDNVLLFTDGQVPSLDDTFKNKNQNEFRIQMWMMILSDIHYGNPLSSVDRVIQHFRSQLEEKEFFQESRVMEPSECYTQNICAPFL